MIFHMVGDIHYDSLVEACRGNENAVLTVLSESTAVNSDSDYLRWLEKQAPHMKWREALLFCRDSQDTKVSK